MKLTRISEEKIKEALSLSLDGIRLHMNVEHKAIAQAQLEACEKEAQEKVRKIRTSLEFANKVAKVMDDLRSSNVFFVLQQAWGDIEWEEAQDILNTVIEQTEQALRKKYLED